MQMIQRPVADLASRGMGSGRTRVKNNARNIPATLLNVSRSAGRLHEKGPKKICAGD